jgi:murein DD-endopeptidase MepM/ murein hydrolase activator NlpD
VKFHRPVLGVVAMAFVFGVAVATSVPAASLARPDSFDHIRIDAAAGEQQSFGTTGDGGASVGRDGYVVNTPTPTPAPLAAGQGADLGGYGGAQCQAGSDQVAEASTFSWPYPDGFRMGDGFGERAEGFHKGVDMLNAEGTPVHAIADGVVIALSDVNSGTGGLYVSIAHTVGGQPLCSMYMHFLEGTITVGLGQLVTTGQVIALTGETGNATAFHTHFELYGSDGNRFDPMPFMTAHAG